MLRLDPCSIDPLRRSVVVRFRAFPMHEISKPTEAYFLTGIRKTLELYQVVAVQFIKPFLSSFSASSLRSKKKNLARSTLLWRGALKSLSSDLSALKVCDLLGCPSLKNPQRELSRYLFFDLYCAAKVSVTQYVVCDCYLGVKKFQATPTKDGPGDVLFKIFDYYHHPFYRSPREYS